MGTLELNDYENLGMMDHSIEMFWNDFEGECDLLKVTMTFECDNDFGKNWWLGVRDTIPALPYNHSTWNG